MPDTTRRFTLEELAYGDGKEGRPAYVVHAGKVYDLTGSAQWTAGRHMNLHEAGRDLSADLPQAPHGEDRLERFPQVGVLDGAGRPGVQPPELPWLLRASPILRRHPHPMTVHFPIAFAIGAALFTLAALVFGGPFFATAVHAMNLSGALFTPVAIFTGLATWKYNYGKSPLTSIKVKLVLSPILLAQFLICTGWWLIDKDVLVRPGSGSDLFGALVFSMVPLVGVIGWLGAGLTFPLHGERK